MKILKQIYIRHYLHESDWKELERWILDAESELQAARDRRRIKKVSEDLKYRLYRLDVLSSSHSVGRYEYMKASIAKHRPILAGVMWEDLRSSFHSDYYRPKPSNPKTLHTPFASNILPILWQLVKMQYCDKSWVDLCSSSSRMPSSELLCAFIKAHHDELGLTLAMYGEVLTIIEECKAIKAKPELAKMATELQQLVAEVPQPVDDWLSYCREAVALVEKKPIDDSFPVASHMAADSIEASELKLLNRVNKDCMGAGRGGKELKAWLEHIKSPKCRETTGRLVNSVMKRCWIVNAYRVAQDDDLFSGPLHKLYGATTNVFQKAIRRKFLFQPEEFDLFVRMLQHVGRHTTEMIPITSRIEEYAAQNSVTVEQRLLLDRYYDVDSPGFDSETKRAISRWKVLQANLKRRVPRKKKAADK